MLKKVKEILVKLSTILNSKIFKYIVFFVYLSLTLILVLNHEIWIDEGQAWEIARTLSIPEIFAQMKYEGHSCLWHLIIAVPAKLGLPVISMNIISFIFVSIAVYMILFKAEWNIFVKIAIIFNSTFIFLMPVISRCYSLIPLLVCLFVIYYPNRHKHPIIYSNILGLLAHTHVIVCPFVGIVALMFIIEYVKNIKKEYKKLIIILLIFLIYFILLVVQILPALENCVIFNNTISSGRFSNIIYLIGCFFFPSSLLSISSYLLLLILLISFILLFLYDKKYSFFFLTMVLGYLIIHLHWPHVLFERTCLLFVLFVLLNFYNKNKYCQIFMVILSISCMFGTSKMFLDDLNGNYSASKDVGFWINENIEDGSLIFFLNAERNVSIVPYINIDVDYYNMKLGNSQTFNSWVITPYLSVSDVYIKLKEFSMQYENIYLIHSIHRDGYAEDTIRIADLMYQDNYITLEYEGVSTEILAERFLVYKLVRI